MKITFKVQLSIGLSGCVRKDELNIEVSDDATPEEIEKEKDSAAEDWMNNFVDLWHD